MRDLEASIAATKQLWQSGPGMHKLADDVKRYQRLIERIRPSVVVETGGYYFGSHFWFAARVPFVVTVEIDEKRVANFRGNVHGLGMPPSNGAVVVGDSVEKFHEVEKLVWSVGGPVLVSLDSDHGTQRVLNEMRLYGELVTPGSYMVAEDGILGHLPVAGFPHGNWFDGSPLTAIAAYLRGEDRWEIDTDLEDLYPTTTSPNGWLRRK